LASRVERAPARRRREAPRIRALHDAGDRDRRDTEMCINGTAKGVTIMPAVAELMTKEEFTTQKLFEVYKQAFMEPHMEDNGEVKVLVSGVKVYAKVDEARFLLMLKALYGVKPEASRVQVLELCNRINDQMILVRACYPSVAPFPMLYLDHYVDTEAGFTAEEAVDETRRFASVCTGIGLHDAEHILT
jgi:hypothetical protein